MKTDDPLVQAGKALLAQGRAPDAVRVLQRAVERSPNEPQGFFFLGHAHLQCENPQAAVLVFAEVVRMLPADQAGLLGYAGALHRAGHADQAVQTYRILLQHYPDFAPAHVEMGSIFFASGALDLAHKSFETALQHDPDAIAAWFNLAQTYRQVEEYEQAARCLREVVTRDPKHGAAHAAMAAIYAAQGRLGDAREAIENALAEGLTGPELHTIHGNILRDLGELKGADFAYRAALSADPGFAAARSNLMYLIAYHFIGTPEERAAEMAAYDRMLSSAARPLAPVELVGEAPDRVLRIGYVSAGFNDSAIAPSFLPTLRHHDSRAVHVTCYSSSVRNDAVTDQMQAHADRWRSVVTLSDAELARQIRQDKIDILVDLSGHTHGNRLGCFVYRPAPVQITWLHALSSLGISAIDYIMLDEDILPATSPEPLIEQPLPMGHFCTGFEPITPYPDPEPKAPGTPIVFGSFNNLWKLNDRVVALWAQILRELPEATLLVKARQLGDERVCQRLRARFSAFGVSPSRLNLHGKVAFADHQAMFHQVDVALDTFPFGGGLTTCEALWMGLPVVTLDGKFIAERLCAAHLRAAGLGSWVARDQDEYVANAIAWAKASARRAQLRGTLRARVKASDLCDHARRTLAVEAAYRQAWHKAIS